MRDEHDGRTRHVASGLEHVENLGLHRHVERRRGLVGENHLRLVSDGERDHHALAHTAGELVGVRLRAFGRARNADDLQQLHGALQRGFFRDVAMYMERFGNLPADGVHGVERRQRVLEDHRDVFAAILRHRVVVEAEKVDAVVGDGAGHVGALGQEADHRERHHGLARARLSDDAEHFASTDVERHVAHGAHRAGFAGEGDRKIADLDEVAADVGVAHLDLLALRRTRVECVTKTVTNEADRKHGEHE